MELCGTEAGYGQSTQNRTKKHGNGIQTYCKRDYRRENSKVTGVKEGFGGQST